MSTAFAYAELGLEPGANEAQVKAAWRRLVSQWHPDRNNRSVAVDKMQRINLAFETIRRAGFGAGDADDAPAAGAEHPAGPAHTGKGATRDAPHSDAGEPRPTIGRKVRLTLEEAAAGCTKVLRGKITETCARCEGAGEGTVAGACEPCGGKGSVHQRAWYGLFSTLVECAACNGEGSAVQPCAGCEGQGKVELGKYSATVRFPHGVRDGDLLHVDARRMRAEASPVNLDIQVELAPHALFTLETDGTVGCVVPVDGFLWVANRAIDVPTLGGAQRLQLNRGQRSYRLPGRGFPVERRGARGDQVVKLVPVFPERLSTDQQILIDQLAATGLDADGRAADPRLRQWGDAMRAWEHSQA